MQENRHHHDVARPSVNVAHETSGGDDEMNVLDGKIRDVGVGLVIEHEQHAGYQENEKARGGRDPQAPGRGPSQAPSVRAHRMQVEKNVAEHKARPGPIRMGSPAPEHRFFEATGNRSEVFKEAIVSRLLAGAYFSRDLAHTLTVVPVATVLPSSTKKSSPPKCLISCQGKPLGAGPFRTEPSLANFEP